MKRAAVVLIALLCAACTPLNRDEGYVYFRLDADPSTLDPAYVVDVSGGTLAAKLFNGLVMISEDLKIIPDVASRWEVSPDGRTYLFHLRNGVRFSNGREVTARDFVYSFTRVLDPAGSSPNRWVLEKISGVKDFRSGRSPEIAGLKARDEHTLVIELESAFGPFLSLLAMTAAYVVPKEEVQRRGSAFGFQPVGTGPYVLERWVPGREVVLKARGDSFAGGPRVKGLFYRVISEDLTAITEFELGNLDVLALSASSYRYFARDPSWKKRILVQEGLDVYYLGFNCSRGPFRNAGVRVAASYAVDVARIFSTYFESRGRLAEGPVPPELRSWPLRYPYRYDPEKARDLLKRSGLPLPVKVDFLITADQNVVDMAEIIQSYLADAGFSVSIHQLEWSAYKEAINRGEPDMFYLSWWADYPDAENFLFPLFHSSNFGPDGNRTRYMNRVVDRLIERGQTAVTDVQRSKAYGEAERTIVRDAPWLPLWHRSEYIILQRRLRNYTKPPIYSSDRGMTIELSEPSGADD